MQTQIPPAPSCPTWCHGRHPDGGWTIDRGGIHKRCERHVVIDLTTEVTLEQYADVADEKVKCSGPYFRLGGAMIAFATAVETANVVLEMAGLAGMAGIIPAAA